MSQTFNDINLTVSRERAILAAALLPGDSLDPHDPLGELRSLADTAGATVVDELMQNRAKVDVKTFMGKGKIVELAQMVAAHRAEVIIFENELSPSQIGNIEEVVKCKVIDRSELILDIFAARAKSHEAKLQVELAQLEYTYPRLKAMWTHLERIVGGGGVAGIGTRGPGEMQLEIDRRLVQRRKTELKKEIIQIQARKSREVAARNKDFFTVGLVGYTNAGKSTLFNTSTGADEFADDRQFTTLSTRTRRWDLGGGDKVMLSDTVGFVRDLPHHLVASFRATLEEAIHSDLLLIVLDVSNARSRQQLDTVLEVLKDIGATGQERLIVLNKIDQIEHNADLLTYEKEFPGAIALSAKTGRGLDVLVERVRMASRGGQKKVTLAINVADGKTLNYLENRTVVLNRRYDGDEVFMTVLLGARQQDQLRAMGAAVRVANGDLLPEERPKWRAGDPV